MFYCLSTVPTSPPLNVSGSAINSTAIIIGWELPAMDGQNGNITSYSLILTEVATNTSTTHNQSGVHIELVIAYLHPYYEYECQIAAETAIGRGPYGDTVITRTLPDGQCCSMINNNNYALAFVGLIVTSKHLNQHPIGSYTRS